MNSYIEEFQGDHEKESELVITIDGKSGAGKGSLARQIGEIMDIKVYSAGDFFRKIASDKDMSVEQLSREADIEVDKEVDRRTLEKGLNETCVIESRIASRVLGDYSDLKIYLTADLEERASRTLKDQDERNAEEVVEDLEKKKQKIQERDSDNEDRYMNYYGVDFDDLEVFDVIMGNTDMSLEEQRQEIKKILRQKFPERFE